MININQKLVPACYFELNIELKLFGTLLYNGYFLHYNGYFLHCDIFDQSIW